MTEYLLKHRNGDTHAEFKTANAAFACQEGLKLDPGNDGIFHFEDGYGHTVVLKDNIGSLGHAHALAAQAEAGDGA